MSNHLKIEIPKDLKDDLQKFGNNIAKNIAITSRDAITNEYAIAVEEFYNAYTPLQYERKWQLRKSFRPYYRNPHGTRYHGGVEITTDKMKEVHSDSNEIVLSYALSGWHGNPNRGIYTPPYIFEHVENYRDVLFGYIDLIAADAIAAAKKESYKLLSF
jgi:hypothetical protein